MEARFQPPERAYTAYIFDCDGTLVESMLLHHRAWRQALSAHGASFDFGWTLFTSRAGMTLEQTVVELNAQFDTCLDPHSVAKHQRSDYRALLPTVEAIEPVVSFARSLAGAAPLAVASGGMRQEVLQSLEIVGIRDLFDPVVTASDVQNGKPDPEMLLRCAQAMRVAPSDCLVIEDGELGIEAARRAGMAWVRVAEPRVGSTTTRAAY